MNTQPAARDILASTACLLFTHGQVTESTNKSIARLGKALGVEVRVLLRWSEVVLLIDGQATPLIYIAKPTALHMGRISAILHMIDEVEAQRMTLAQAARELDSIAQMPTSSTLRFSVMAGAAACGLAVIFGASTLATFAVIFFSAFCGGLMRRLAARITPNTLVQPLIAALIAGAAGSLSVHVGLDADLRLTLICPCMILMPGPHFLNGSIDLVRARISLGTARLVFACLLVLMICIGLLLGLALGNTSLPLHHAPFSVPLLHNVIAAGLAVAGYGTFYNMAWRVLPLPIVVGMSAHGMQWLLLDWGVAVATATLGACAVAGLLSAVLAQHLRQPFAAFAFAAVVCMIPGLYLFDAAAALVRMVSHGQHEPLELLLSGAINGVQAILIILAMTVGLIVPKMLYDSYHKHFGAQAQR